MYKNDKWKEEFEQSYVAKPAKVYTVKDIYPEITFEVMEKLEEDESQDPDYWGKAQKFVESVYDKDVSHLSSKQMDWLSGISDVCGKSEL